MDPITLALPYPVAPDNVFESRFSRRLGSLADLECLSRILVLYQGAAPRLTSVVEATRKVALIEVDSWFSTSAINRTLDASVGDLMLGIPPVGEVDIGPRAFRQFAETAKASGAGLVYSDFRSMRGSEIIEIATIDYQMGSIRESFNFGPLVFIPREALEESLKKYGPVEPSLRWTALYDLRLKQSIDFPIVRIPEPLYVVIAAPARPVERGGVPANEFDLVDLNDWEYQLELERLATSHLKRIGAYLDPVTTAPPPPGERFPVTASVVIPVRNREKTISQAIESALNQQVSFDYNIIVVNDHSSDRTADIVRALAARHSSIIHKTPARRDLGIGGLWNEAVYSAECGLFAVQLDSDDLFADPRALEKLINKFWQSPADVAGRSPGVSPRYAMVTGSFTHVNFDLEQVPPGLFLHKEFSEENGRNNALRMNGLGAPRAFYVPALRRFGFPNVSYGEDYAICLRICREYEIGRVFEPLYLARQWEGNTSRSMPLGSIKSFNLKELLPPGMGDRPDLLMRLQPLVATLMMASKNRYDSYKDWLRTIEIKARQGLRERADGPAQRSHSF